MAATPSGRDDTPGGNGDEATCDWSLRRSSVLGLRCPLLSFGELTIRRVVSTAGWSLQAFAGVRLPTPCTLHLHRRRRDVVKLSCCHGTTLLATAALLCTHGSPPGTGNIICHPERVRFTVLTDYLTPKYSAAMHRKLDNLSVLDTEKGCH